MQVMRSTAGFFGLLGLVCACSSDAVLVGSDHATLVSQGGTQSSDPEQAGSAGQSETNSGQDPTTAGDMPDMPTVGDPASSLTPSGNSATGTDSPQNIADGNTLGADAGSPDQASDGGILPNDQSAGNNTGGTSAGTDTNAAGTGA